VGANAWKIDLYKNYLRFIDIGWGIVAGSIGMPDSGTAELVIYDWSIIRNNDGYLRFYQGTDHSIGANDFTVGAGGNAWLANALNVPNINGGPNLIMKSAASYAAVYGKTDTCGVLVGHQYGVGDLSKVGVHGQVSANGWSDRPLTVTTAGGTGEVGIGFYQGPKGWTGAFQMYYDGSYYIGCLNGANSAYIKSYASAFTVQSSRRFKGEIELAERRSLREVVRRIKPVRFRDLQDELSREASYFAPDDYRGPNGERIIPDKAARERLRTDPPSYRYGMIAEEVEEVLPELVGQSHLGPGLELNGLVAVLWQVVRELVDEVDELKGATT